MKDRSDGQRREEIAGCRTVVGDAERPCGHDDDAHGPEGCMWCDCAGFDSNVVLIVGEERYVEEWPRPSDWPGIE